MQCPNCKTVWPDDLAPMLKFCGACGKPLGEEAPAPLTPTYAGKPLRTDPGGELRFVTVLFADLAGFTSYAEDRRPDDVAQAVGGLLRRLGTVIEQFGGGVYQFLGDAVVATFGLPRPDPNAARNAVRAGLEMQKTAGAYAAETGLPLKLRVGIHAGDVMFGALGGSWTIMGDTVNTASRVQSAAQPGRVWISRTIYVEVRRFFALIPRPAVELKGKKQTVQPYEVIAERQTPALEQPSFVGREEEWAALQNALQRCLAEKQLGLVFVHGPAGIGKSRLVWELRDYIQRSAAAFRVDVAQFDHSERLPAHGLNSLIRNRFNLPLDLTPEAIVSGISANLRSENPYVEPGRERQAVELLSFALGVSLADFQTRSIDGRSKWENLYLVVKEWIEGQAAETPWVWILEDVQKGDAQTAEFVNWAIRVPWKAPMLVVITAREEDFLPDGYWYDPVQDWLKNGVAREIRLQEINPVLLADALAGLSSQAIPLEVARRIAEHTEGNPLFATELMLLLKDQGMLTSELRLEQVSLPLSVREVMEARLERLGVNGKEVAKRGALMGRRFTVEAVERIWERAQNDLTDGLVVLRESETVFEEASRLFAGEIEQVFRHGRLQEAALARIPREERLRWLIGLENWARSKLVSLGENWETGAVMLVPLIARSLEENGKDALSGLWYELLAHLHRRRHRSSEAIQSFEKALSGAAGVRRKFLALNVADILLYSGQVEKSVALCRDILDNPDPVDSRDIHPDLDREVFGRLKSLSGDLFAFWDTLEETEARAALMIALGGALDALGTANEAQTIFEQVRLILESSQSRAASRLWVRWGRRYANVLSEVFMQPAAANEICQRARRHADLHDPDPETLSFLLDESWVQCRLGHYQDALTVTQEALALAELAGDQHNMARSQNGYGMIATAQGDYRLAADAYQRSIQISQGIGFRRGEIVATHNLGIVLFDQLALEAAESLQERYLQLSRAYGNRMAEAYAPLYIGACAVQAGQFDSAHRLFEKGTHIAEEYDWPRLVGLGQALFGVLYFHEWLKDRNPAKLRHAVESFSSSEQIWKRLDEAGEFYACLTLALYFLGEKDTAIPIMETACRDVDESWLEARYWLEGAQSLLTGQGLEKTMQWFAHSGHLRATRFFERVKEIEC